jgi:hypothetical protein
VVDSVAVPLRRIVSIASAIAVGATLAWSTSAGAQPAPQDSVTGTFTTGNTRADFRFTFDTHSGPSGENPSGTVGVFSIGEGDLGTFPVSCLAVSGNHATVVAPFPFGPPVPAGIVIRVEDNGATGDRVAWDFVSSLPTSCPPPTTVPANTEPRGDVTVVDARPFPTTKDQCKGGGWRSFPGFKNQGDCVSFVATEGKNSPSGS